ncbi:hypothetical protein GWI33_014740, partial [Rhynchophorus ferrugineus]
MDSYKVSHSTKKNIKGYSNEVSKNIKRDLAKKESVKHKMKKIEENLQSTSPLADFVEDDYGNESTVASAFYDKLMEKYSKFQVESKFNVLKAKPNEAVVKGYYKKTPIISTKLSRNVKVDSKPKSNLPPISFQDLMKIAEKNQFELVEKKSLNKKQNEEIVEEKEQSKGKETQSKNISPKNNLKKGTSDPSGKLQVKPKYFPPKDIRTKQFPFTNVQGIKRRRSMTVKKGRIQDDSDEEYDSDLDDFIIEGPEEKPNYSGYIKEIFGYDKSKYTDCEDDIYNMESSFAQQMREEAISKKIGTMEDLKDMKLEQEKKREKARMKK